MALLASEKRCDQTDTGMQAAWVLVLATLPAEPCGAS